MSCKIEFTKILEKYINRVTVHEWDGDDTYCGLGTMIAEFVDCDYDFDILPDPIRASSGVCMNVYNNHPVSLILQYSSGQFKTSHYNYFSTTRVY